MQEAHQAAGETVHGPGGRYLLETRIGRGGAGEVFRAQDRQLERRVAIKRLHNAFGVAPDDKLREARNLASLQHPNIVTVYDFLEENGDILVVMELLEGRTLDQIAANAPLLGGDFAEMMRQILEGLVAAHALGMIHRDIKPGNLMILDLPSGAFQVKILDFGLACMAAGPTVPTVDEEGCVTGSVFYMPPEQLEGGLMDARSDLYSLGCVAYFALCSRNPFVGATVAEVIESHLNHTLVPLSTLRPDLPPSLCAWVDRLMARHPTERPDSAAQALAELQEAFYQGKPPTQPVALPPPPPARPGTPWTWLVPAVAGIVASVALGLWFLRPATVPPVPPQPAPPAQPMAASAPAPSALLSPADTATLLGRVGKQVTVEGVIERGGVSKTGAIRFLNFAGTRRGDLTLVFFVKSNPELYTEEHLARYIGQNVRVQGQVSLFEGTPQIVIGSLDQITSQ